MPGPCLVRLHRLIANTGSRMKRLATTLVCFTCAASYASEAERVLCSCGQPLEQRYDLASARRLPRATVLGDNSSLGVWRYRTVLPVADDHSAVSLGEGGTPLIPLVELSRRYGLRLYLKNEGGNPTGSFKARGASVGVSRLKELGWRRLAIGTVGNGGSAWAAYAARAGLRLTVALPTTPGLSAVGLFEPRFHGAEMRRYPEPLDEALNRDLEAGTLNVGAFREPYRIEGDKTLLYEAAEQLDWRLPDHVIWPTGGAVGLVGLAKALEEMRELGWVREESEMSIISVQHADAPPVSRALRGGLTEIENVQAAGIAPGVWPGDTFAGRYILARLRSVTKAYGATAGDEDIRRTIADVAVTEGILLSPEGALSVAAIEPLLAESYLQPNDSVICFNTASSLRYPHLPLEVTAAKSGTQ